MAGKKIALFIDADNISPKFGKKILETLESRGELFIRRIYGNWEKSSLHGWNEAILNCSLRAIQQPDFVTGKNATDMSLTIDAMDVLHDGKAEIFALVSNDSDFTPLVIRLREGNVAIIGLGNAHASVAFRSACTEFIELDSLEQPIKTVTTAPTVTTVPQISSPVANNVKLIPIEKGKPVKKIAPTKKKIAPDKKGSPVQMSLFDEENFVKPAPEPKPKSLSSKVVPITDSKTFIAQDKLQAVHDVLQEAAQLHGDKNGFAELCWAGQTLHEKNFNFGVKDFGYNTLREFIAAFPDRYEITTHDNKTVLYYRCRINKRKNSSDDKLEKMHATLREAIKKSTVNKDGFIPLSWAGNFLSKKHLGFGVKDFGYSTLQKFIAAFPDRYDIINRDEGVFYYRCHIDEPTAEEKLQRLHNVLHAAAIVYNNDNGLTLLNYAGQFIRDSQLGFGVKDFGYSTLRKFITAFPDLYELINHGDGIFYRCRTNNPAKSPAVDELKQLHDVLSEVANLHADADGFVNLWWVCDFVTGKKNLTRELRTLSHQKFSELVAQFPDRYELIHPNGGDICYRCLPNAF